MLGVQCVEEGIEGWAITIEVRAEDMQRTECLLTLAKEALLENAERGAKVVGHRWTPFLLFPQGFIAMLGFVQDESKACYDAYGKGFCRRGGSCRWQHPPCTKAVKVVMTSAAEESLGFK